METATQTLHWLTSYQPDRAWDVPVPEPRVPQDLVTNGLDRSAPGGPPGTPTLIRRVARQ